MATQKVLAIPELLDIIFEALNEIGDLKQACLVNSTWSSRATSIVWQYPTLSALAALRPVQRRLCSHYVLALCFSNDTYERYNEELQGLDFSQLKQIFITLKRKTNRERISFLGCGSQSWMRQYLHAGLEELELHDCTLLKSTLDHVRSHCPRLRSFRIVEVSNESLADGVTPDDFLEFLHGCNNLTSLSLIPFSEDLSFLSDELFSHILTLKGLKKLELDSMILIDVVAIQDAMRVSAADTFENLDSLRMSLEAIAIPSIVSPATNLRLLNLIAYDQSDAAFLASIATLKLLEILRLRFCCDNLSTSNLLLLQHLRQLRCLRLDTIAEGAKIVSPGANDDVLTQLLSRLPDLQVLSLELECEFTEEAIVAIAAACPNLKLLNLFGAYDLGALARLPAFAFRSLNWLCLGQYNKEANSENPPNPPVHVTTSVIVGILRSSPREEIVRAFGVAEILWKIAPRLNIISSNKVHPYDNFLALISIKFGSDLARLRAESPKDVRIQTPKAGWHIELELEDGTPWTNGHEWFEPGNTVIF